MKYPYISIRPLIDEVAGDLKNIVKTSQFSDEDMYVWAVDAMRMIGGNNYDNDGECYLTVNKHCAILPKDFYLIDTIWYCEGANLAYTTRQLQPHEEPFRWIKTKILRPASAGDLRFCIPGCIKPNVAERTQSYKLQVPPGIARFGFHTGKVFLKYLKLKTDTDGTMMIQDEINGLIFVKNYIKKMLLQEKWILKEVTADVYRVFSDEADKYLTLAQQSQKFTSPADTMFLAAKQDAKFRRFRHKNQ